ncbi:hypothetical protein MKX03_036890 [Papaver bracteatum]|nr:hypothetical protein MKX03_036890 [Papaver bracteatum]
METMHEKFTKLFKNSNQNNATSGGCFTCEICTETLPLNKQFKNMEAISGCFHPYCTDCVAKYIETKVIHDSMSDIKCPNTNCSVHLDALSCRSILPKKIFEKWCRVLCESAVLLDASKAGFAHGRCFFPNRKCSELILNEFQETRSSVKRSDCPNFKKVFCFSCMVPWNQNHQCHQTCDTVVDIDMDRNFRCPNCNHCIEPVLQSEGFCNIITCRFFLALSISSN